MLSEVWWKADLDLLMWVSIGLVGFIVLIIVLAFIFGDDTPHMRDQNRKEVE